MSLITDTAKRSVAAAALALLLDASAASSPPVVTVTTWNLEHMMSEAQFEQWRAFCESVDWDDEKAGPNKLPTITYCSAHNGLSFPDRRPQSLPLRTAQAFVRKVDALKERASTLNSDVYAFQEVSDADAVQRILPRGSYRVFATSAAIPQQLAFAVKASLANGASVRVVEELAMPDSAGRPVRPGLELTLTVGSRTIKMLNVHLKASCPRYVIDAPDLSKTKDAGHRRAVEEGCRVLRKQVPILERWVDDRANAGELFMIIGDTNRNVAWEWSQKISARLPGSDSMDAAAPITERTKIGSLLAELNDRSPSGAVLWFARQTLKTDGRRSCHRGIDNFMVGDRLKKALAAEQLRSFGEDYGKDAYGLDRARPSDHCPLTLTVQFR